MGVTDSIERVSVAANEALQILNNIPEYHYKKTMAKLLDLQVNFQMQVSKWDLLLIMDVKAVDLCQIMTLITKQADSHSVNTHKMIVLLVLARK
jgi:hypothetical protein